MFVKIHKSYRTVVAVCDSNLLGKKFEEKFENGIKQLDVRENFYKGEDLPYDKVIQIMKTQKLEDATFNIVGEESIKTAIEAGLITKEEILKVQGIPYALVLL